jgi:histone deacetylase 1/2
MGQDQANLSSIQGSLTPAVAGLIIFAKTSHEAWTILERSFTSQPQARANALCRELGDCEKLDSTATEFYNKVKALADTLASIGHRSPTPSSTPSSSMASTRSTMVWSRSLMREATQLP